MDTERQGDFKNALPGEVTDHPDSGMPRQLRTQADDDPAWTRAAADAAGMTHDGDSRTVYADSDSNQQADDQLDAHHAEPDEHL